MVLLNIFKAISEFVFDLELVFGKSHKEVLLYKRLLSKTTILNEGPVKRHVNIFKTFIDSNISAITEKCSDKLVTHKLIYSERVFIDLYTLLKECDKDTETAVWNHLLKINALINPSEQSLALTSFLTNSQNNTSAGGDDDLLSDLITTVKDSLTGETVTNPMETAMSLVSSGKLSNIISTMTQKFSSGALNPEDLLKKVMNIYTTETQGNEDAPDINQFISSIVNTK